MIKNKNSIFLQKFPFSKLNFNYKHEFFKLNLIRRMSNNSVLLLPINAMYEWWYMQPAYDGWIHVCLY